MQMSVIEFTLKHLSCCINGVTRVLRPVILRNETSHTKDKQKLCACKHVCKHVLRHAVMCADIYSVIQHGVTVFQLSILWRHVTFLQQLLIITVC